MSELNKLPIILEDLIVADRKALEAKLADFTISNIHVVFDFDRTLTVRKPETNDEVTTWHILRDHLPDEGKKQYSELFNRYRKLEVDGTMSQSDAAEWWSSSLQLFVDHKINLARVEEDFLDRASIRPGTTELFEFCKQQDIPTVILSAGIREVIEIWSRRYNIDPSLVISTVLSLDNNMQIIGWQSGSMVHVLNKSEADHEELRSIRIKRPNAVVVGDSISDASMAEGDENVLRVRILDNRDDEANASSSEHEKTFIKFDALIESGTLNSLTKLLKSIEK